MTRLGLISATLAVALTGLFSQGRMVPRTTFVMNFDYARFHNNDSSAYVEMYFAFFPRLVTLQKTGDSYQGFVRLRTQVTSVESGASILDRNSVLPVSVKDSADEAYRNTLVTETGVLLKKGEYRLRVEAFDSLDSGRKDSISLPLSIETDRQLPAMSDLQLCSSIRHSDTATDAFYKNTYEVVPNPTLLFGTSSYPVIFRYIEFYGLDTAATYIVKSTVLDQSGKPVQESSKSHRYGVRNAVEVGTLNTTKLHSGRYELQLYLLTQNSEPVVHTEKRFYVFNPNLNQPTVSDARMMETELSGLTAEELGDEFREAQYYATEAEIKTFAQISSLEGKREFLAKFWSQVEKGKLGHYPVTRIEYLNRVKKANDRYHALAREGWRTDRGRVYLLYSEPDEIERRPSSEGGKPYEIWNYYQIENGVIFVFVDRTGFGDYVLVNSTKRGELRDDDWQRFLQQ